MHILINHNDGENLFIIQKKFKYYKHFFSFPASNSGIGYIYESFWKFTWTGNHWIEGRNHLDVKPLYVYQSKNCSPWCPQPPKIRSHAWFAYQTNIRPLFKDKIKIADYVKYITQADNH